MTSDKTAASFLGVLHVPVHWFLPAVGSSWKQPIIRSRVSFGMQLSPLYSRREMSAWEETHAAWNAEILEVRQSNQLVLETALWWTQYKTRALERGPPGLCPAPNATGDLRSIPPLLWIFNYSVRAWGDWTKWLTRFLPAQIVHSVNTFNIPTQLAVICPPPISQPSHCYWALSPRRGCGGVGYSTIITSIPIVISTVFCVLQMNEQINGALEHRECALE